MMSIILLAAAVDVLGDFDRDGLVDRAYVRASAGVSELVVERATGQTVVVDRFAKPTDFYFGRMPRGDYRTACGKGLGGDGGCAVPLLSVRGDVLQFGTREASQAVAVWENGQFQIHWLSD